MGTQFLRFHPAALLHEEASASTRLPLGEHVMGTWSVCVFRAHGLSATREQSSGTLPPRSRWELVCMGVVYECVFARVAYVCCVCELCVVCACLSRVCSVCACVHRYLLCVCVCLHVEHMYVVVRACVLCV